MSAARTKGALVHMITSYDTECAPCRQCIGSRMAQEAAPAPKTARGPFAAPCVSLPAMTEITAARLFRRKPIRRYAGMGAAYAWLRAYHREVANALASREQSWATLVEDMALDGVTSRSGAPLTGNATLRVWPRVCRDVEAHAVVQAQAAAKRKRMPSSRSPDWRPEVVPPAAGAALPAGVAQAPRATDYPVAASPWIGPQARPEATSLQTAPAGLDVQPGEADLSHLDEAGRARVKAVQDALMEQLTLMGQKIYGP